MRKVAISLIVLILLSALPEIEAACAAGTQCDGSGNYQRDCYTGWYNPGGVNNCSPCPAGSYCPQKAFIKTCPVDIPFSYLGGGECLACPAGYSCSPGSAATPCDDGYYSKSGSNYCSPCPPGYSCADRTADPVACTSGYYSSGTQSYCTPCNPGQYCPRSTASSYLTCPLGTTSTFAQDACTVCPAGKYCPRADLTPLDCLTGEYSLAGAVSCTRCEAGKECSTKTALGADCPAGKFSLTGQTACTTCPAGYFCANRNSIPALCSAGTYSLAGAVVCTPCPVGKLCQYIHQAESGTCTAGYYQLGEKGFCKQCEPGYYCATADKRKGCPKGAYSVGLATACTDCPLGSYCPVNNREPLTCPDGSYCPVRSSIYQECPIGYYCTNPSTAPATCSSGTYSLGKQKACTTCPDGFYCPTTTGPPILCASGFYTPSTGLTSCTECPAGSYCPGSLAAHLKTTPSGSYSEARMTYYIPCLPGYSCSTTASTACAQGYYSTFNQATACTQCEAGSACPTTWSINKYTCPAGTYSTAGSVFCTVCPAGSSCTTTVVTACIAGTFAPAGSTACTTCPTGFYCPYLNAPNTFPCPAGTYSAAGAAFCTICPAGSACYLRTTTTSCTGQKTYAPDGSHVCAPCPGGSSCTGGIATPCAAGRYSAAGDIVCTDCPAGSYCPTGTSWPILCPAGMYASGTNNILCTACALGYYSIEGAISCTSCTAGSYCPAPHITPRTCPIGTFADAGAYQCTPCTVGKYCPAGTATATLQACPAGYYCNYATALGFGGVGKIPCPAGTKRTTTSAEKVSDCTACTAGKYCPEASSAETACPKGHYCPAGTRYLNQYPCPPGTFNNANGGTSSASCSACTSGNYCPVGSPAEISCPPGYYCPAGTGYLTNNNLVTGGYYSDLTPQSTSSSQSCPAGYYCPIGSVFPIPCPPGTYKAGTGGVNRGDCLKCTAGKPCPKYANILADNGIDCPKGYYCPEGTEYPRQYPCPPGKYNDIVGKAAETDCLACTAGYACDGGTNTDTNPMKKCLPGYYCPAGSASPKQVPCAAGKYSTLYTQSTDVSVACDAGYYCLPGSDRFTGECQEGYFCLSGATVPNSSPCPAGSYSNKRGLKASTDCTTCPIGYYCPQASTAPLPCPGGTYNKLTGKGLLADCLTCDAGYYCPAATTDRIACGLGKYSPAGAKLCIDCVANYYCNTATTSDTTMLTNKCGAGYYCPKGTGTYPSTAVTCPAGYYCGPEVDHPTKCSPGQISASTASVCIAASAGTYTVRGSGTPTGACTPGYYCPSGSWSSKALACPGGKYIGTAGGTALADCIMCPKGSYCPEATAIPILCPQGYYCTDGLPLPLKCPIGTYGSRFGLQASTECTDSPPGTYCSLPGLSAPEGLTDAGYFCDKAAQTSTPQQTVTCNICPAGGFCETGSRVSQSCPPGRYNPNTGGRDLDACVLCPPGKYCSGEAKASATGDCDPGYYCPTGSYMKNMYPANPGYYTLTGNATQMPCAEGFYNPYYAQSNCLACPPGFLCKGTANAGTFINCPIGYYCPIQSILPTPCAKGTYNPNYNGKSSSYCLACPPGKYCSMEGLYAPGDGTTTSDSDCDAGYFCKISSDTKAPDALAAGGIFGPCAAGFYCPKGISSQIPCPPGTYSDLTKIDDVSKCKSCTAGSYCSSGGLAAVEGPCDAGYFCVLGSKVPRPTPCPIGNYCPQGSAVASPCLPGYYQDETAQSTCKDCPPGYFCEQGTSSLASKDCPKGYYCPQNTPQSTQNPCPIGTYNPNFNAISLAQCILCDPGYYCLGTGRDTVSGQCKVGYFCKMGSPTDSPPSTATGAPSDHGNICPLGSYCPLGSAMPIKCPGGKYCGATTLATPQGDCLAGYYCRLGSTSKTPTNLAAEGGNKCNAGHYCVTGSDSPTPCPPGTFSPYAGNTALTDCQPCSNGKYCQDAGAVTETGSCAVGYFCKLAGGATIGYTSPNPASQLCPIGYQCPIGTVDKIACANTYQDLKGQGTCNSCPAGYYCTATEKFLCRPRLENWSYYCPADVMDKIACPAGTYNMIDGTSSINECAKCPPGYYCPVNAGFAKIIQCIAGYYCKTQGASVSTGDGKCPAGYYCPIGTYNPIACPAGRFCDVDGLTDSILTDINYQCTAGYICRGGCVSPTPTDGTNGNICPSGFYCPKGTVTPIACPIGYYRSLLGGAALGDCTQCPAGNTCPSKGMSMPTIVCPAGYYCGTGSSLKAANPCPKGAMCPSGSSTYTVCSDKTYQNMPTSVSCIDCPARFFCKNTGSLVTASKPVECPAGKYCPLRTDNPIDCPVSTFSARTGLASDSECDPCTPGSYCQTTGLTTPTGQCDAGYYCSGGSKVKTPNDATGNICSKGAYCPLGTITPIPCPPGTYNDYVGKIALTDCLACVPGYFCPLRGATSMDLKFGASEFKCLDGYLCITKATIPNPTDGTTGRLCVAGKYCPAGATVELPCEKGYYNPNDGQKECLLCPAGKLCDVDGLTAFKDCPAGYYCLAGSYSATACPAGTYSPFTDLESADECIECDPGKYCVGAKTAPDGTCSAGYVCPKKSNVAFSYALYSEAANTPGQCPLGYMCPAGSSAPTPCPQGTYNDQAGKDVCTPCQPGKYCDELGSTSSTKDCAAGHLCVSGAKQGRPITQATEGGKLCSPGNYCPEGTTVEKPCPAGKFEPRSGSFACQTCPPGYYCTGATVTPTDCPEKNYCPAGSSAPTPCPDGTFGRPGSTKLERDDQCTPCPSGKYCKLGLITGDCKAKYYCDVGASKDQDTSKLCPAGHYCLLGAKLPTRCPNGKFNMDVGAGDSTACLDCTTGYYCIAGSSVPIKCPSGHYCPPPASKPFACAEGTYQPDILMESITACKYCPSGTYCYEKAVYDPTMYPCPVGQYCLDANSTNYAPFNCPNGTYRNVTGAKTAAECLSCPGGYTCTLGTIHPKPCKGGSYCSGTTAELDCPAGYYCPPISEKPIICPAAYYCPAKSEIYIKCENGYYCPTGSFNQTRCPSGFVGSYNPNNINVTLGCTLCTPGYYSVSTGNLLQCMACTEGYVCLGGTNTDKPKNIATEGGQECPIGFYCPAGTYKPTACPQGTYNNLTLRTSLSDCKLCDSGTFNPYYSSSSCMKCGGSSVSADDRTTCVCKGKYRAYQVQNGACTCMPFYEPVPGFEKDEASDCQPIIYDRCANDQIRDPAGKCVMKNDCPECPGGKGTRSPGIGVCECVKVDVLDNVCNDSCRNKAAKVAISYSGALTITDPNNPGTTITLSRESVPSLFGSASCPTVNCKVASMVMSKDKGFSATYQPTPTISKKSGTSRLLSESGRVLQTSTDTGITNPIICLNLGDTMIFSVSQDNYPAYDKDNLLNSNPNFDYSQFSALATKIATDSTITDFAFTFIQAGRYVFTNKGNKAQITIIGIMASNEKCSDSSRYIQPISTSSLLKLGVSQNADIILTPDWGLIFGLIIAILFGTPLLIGFIKYFSQSSWIRPKSEIIDYREVNKNADYEEFTSKGKEWKRDLFKGPNPELLQPNQATAPMNVLVDEDNPLIARPNDHEKQIIEMRKKENIEGVHEIPTDIFRDLYKELQYHAKFVKDEFSKKAGLDSDNIKKVFGEIDRLKLLMQEKLQNIAKSYGRGIRLIFDENVEGEGLFIERDEQDENDEDKRREENKSVISESDEEKVDTKIEFNPELLEEMNVRDEQKVDEIAERLREDQAEMEKEMTEDEKLRRIKFEEEVKANTKLTPEEKKALLADYDKSNAKLQKLLMIEGQASEDKLKQMLDQRRKRRLQMQDEITKLEQHKQAVQDEFEIKQKEIEAQKAAISAGIDQEIEREKAEEIAKLEANKNEQLQDVRKKFQKELKEDMTEAKRTAMLERFSSKMKSLEEVLEESRKKEQEQIMMRLDMKRQNRKAEREMELKKREHEIKEEESKEMRAINTKIANLNDNLKNEQMDEMIKQAQEEEEKAEEAEGAEGQAATPEQEYLKQVEQNKEKEKQKLDELENKIDEEKKQSEKEEQEAIKALELDRSAAEKQTQTQIVQAKTKKAELTAKLAKATTPAEKKKLLEEYQKYESEVAERVQTELSKQNATFEDKIAERKRKRMAKEAEARANQEKELEDLRKSNRQEEAAIKRRIDEQKLQRQIEKMKMKLTQDELPFAVERLLDEKHMNELAELLRIQLHDKALILKSNMEKLLKMKMKAVQKAKEEVDSQVAHFKHLADKGLLKKEDYMLKIEDLKERKEKLLKEVEYEFAQKQNELEEHKLMEQEKINSEELIDLMKNQSNEKQIYMQAFISDEFLKKILAGDKSVLDKETAEYERDVRDAFAKRTKEIEEKRKHIEDLLLKDSDKIRELEAQAQKMIEEQEMRDKKREEKNKKEMEARLASKEEELSKQKGITDEEKKQMLEEHQKILDALSENMEKERARQREMIKEKIQEKLKQKELLKKQRDEQIALFQKEEEKLLDAKVKEIQKEKGIETEEEKGNLAQLNKKYDYTKFMYEKVKPLAGITLEPEKEEENVLKGILESKKKSTKEPNKIDLSFELLFDRLRKLESSVGTITGLQFEQIFAGFLDLNNKLENITSGNIPKAPAAKLEAAKPDADGIEDEKEDEKEPEPEIKQEKLPEDQ